MIQRPWVFANELHAYSDNESVRSRSGAKLAIDIKRAEEFVIAYTNNRFDGEGYLNLPDSVRTAVLILAEMYAKRATDTTKGFKSETFDDYSYTKAENSLDGLDMAELAPLLDAHKIRVGNVDLRLRNI